MGNLKLFANSILDKFTPGFIVILYKRKREEDFSTISLTINLLATVFQTNVLGHLFVENTGDIIKPGRNFFERLSNSFKQRLLRLNYASVLIEQVDQTQDTQQYKKYIFERDSAHLTVRLIAAWSTLQLTREILISQISKSCSF